METRMAKTRNLRLWRAAVVAIAAIGSAACERGQESEPSTPRESPAPRESSVEPAREPVEQSAGAVEQVSAAIESGETVDQLALQGRRAYTQCAPCHAAVDPSEKSPPRRVGPNLWGVYGADAGVDPNFRYSPALMAAEVVWTDAALDAFLKNPRAYIPGNRMSYPGEADPARRGALIAYLKTLGAAGGDIEK